MSGAVEGVALLPCPNPWCKSGVPPMPFINRDSSVAVICGCDFHGPAMASRDEAIAAWNTRTTPPARSYADEDRVTIARALAERFIERGNARVTGSVHASWEAMPWSYRRDFLADADAVINVLSQGEKV